MTHVHAAMSHITMITGPSLETMLHGHHILLLEFSGTALIHQVTDIDFSLLSSFLPVTLAHWCHQAAGPGLGHPGHHTTLVTATNTHQPPEPTQLLILNLQHHCLLCTNWPGLALLWNGSPTACMPREYGFASAS